MKLAREVADGVLVIQPKGQRRRWDRAKPPLPPDVQEALVELVKLQEQIDRALKARERQVAYLMQFLTDEDDADEDDAV